MSDLIHEVIQSVLILCFGLNQIIIMLKQNEIINKLNNK